MKPVGPDKMTFIFASSVVQVQCEQEDSLRDEGDMYTCVVNTDLAT